MVLSEITAQSYNKFLDKLCDYQDNVRLEENLVGDRAVSYTHLGNIGTFLRIDRERPEKVYSTS